MSVRRLPPAHLPPVHSPDLAGSQEAGDAEDQGDTVAPLVLIKQLRRFLWIGCSQKSASSSQQDGPFEDEKTEANVLKELLI